MFKEEKLLHGHKQTVSVVIFEVNSFLFLVNHVVQTVCFGQKYREYQHQLFNKQGRGEM